MRRLILAALAALALSGCHHPQLAAAVITHVADRLITEAVANGYAQAGPSYFAGPYDVPAPPPPPPPVYVIAQPGSTVIVCARSASPVEPPGACR